MTRGCVEQAPAGPNADFGMLIALPRGEAVDLLGTERPTRDQVEAKRSELMALSSRWVGTYLTVYSLEGEPVELFFTGFSGD